MANLSPRAQQLIADAQRGLVPTREDYERAHRRFERAITASPAHTEFVLKKPLLRLLVLGALFLGANSSAPQSLQSGLASSGQLEFEAVRAAAPRPTTDNAPERPTPIPASDNATLPLPAARTAAPRVSQAAESSHAEPSADTDSLRRELAALDAARRSAATAHYSEALQVLASVEFRQLAVERDALKLWLRCKKSDASAVTAARSFLAQHPDHPMFSKVREACLPKTTRSIPGQQELPESAKDMPR